MKLGSKLAHVYLDTVRRYPEIDKVLTEYFQHRKGRFGYHASQLIETHGLPKALANQMSAALNSWADTLDQLATMPTVPIPGLDIERLARCTRSMSSLSRTPLTCKSKMCPWCRAVKVVQVERFLALSGATGCILTDIPVEASDCAPKAPRTPANVVLTVKNMVRKDGGLVLRVAHFYRDYEPGMCKSCKSVIRDIVHYDFKLLSSPVAIAYWIKASRDLNMFNRPIKTGKLRVIDKPASAVIGN
jgi:hypothetical protein